MSSSIYVGCVTEMSKYGICYLGGRFLQTVHRGHFREPERDFFFPHLFFKVVASVISASALKRASHPVARFGVAPPKLC